MGLGTPHNGSIWATCVKSPLHPPADGGKSTFWATSLDLGRVGPLGAPREGVEGLSSPAGHNLEMKAEARVAFQVTMAVLFMALLVTAVTFAGEYRGFHLVGNVSEILRVVVQVPDPPPCSQPEHVLSRRGAFG